MLDQPDSTKLKPQFCGPPLDFQEHLARLEAAGLLEGVDGLINKDTEAASAGALAIPGRALREEQRRALLFTNVVYSAWAAATTRRSLVGALAALSRSTLDAVGMGWLGRGDRRGLAQCHRQLDPAAMRAPPWCRARKSSSRAAPRRAAPGGG